MATATLPLGSLKRRGEAAVDTTLVRELSQEQAAALLDRRARTFLGMSGEDFAGRVERREALPDHPMVAHLLLMIGARPHKK